MNEHKDIYEEFVRVLHGECGRLYRFGTDRVRNAEDYCHRNAVAMLALETDELHPDVVESYRREAASWIEYCNRAKINYSTCQPLEK